MILFYILNFGISFLNLNIGPVNDTRHQMFTKESLRQNISLVSGHRPASKNFFGGNVLLPTSDIRYWNQTKFPYTKYGG